MFKFLDKFSARGGSAFGGKREQFQKANDKKSENTHKKAVEMKEERSAPKRAKKDAREMKSNAWSTIVSPLVTEKSTTLAEGGQYAFRVATSANKTEITKAVNELYGVHVSRVNIVRTKGKTVVFGRTRGKQSDTKKAIVTVGKGEKIELYE